jgi:hypothetical protein
MRGGSERGLAGHRSQTAVSGPLVEMGRWLEDQGLSADALVPLLRYLRGLGAAPWTGAVVAAPARAGQRNEALVPVAADVRRYATYMSCTLPVPGSVAAA